MNTEDYVSYPIAKSLKAAGFDWPCDHIYLRDRKSDEWEFADWKVDDKDYNKRTRPQLAISAPLLYQAQKWLREVKGIAINVIAHDGGAYDYDIVFLPNAVDCDYPIDRATFSRTYEEALSEGLESALKLLDNEK